MKLSTREIVGVVIIVLVLAFVFITMTGVFKKPSSEEVVETGNQAFTTTITYNGHEYTYNNHLTNILFLGVDTNDMLGDWSGSEAAGQSDSIFILTLNDETHEVFILQINRNSMTELDMFNVGGQVTETRYGQVTLQYAYGTGGAQSAWAAKRTVSEMLGGLRIDSYLVMNIPGIAPINDTLGGVDVTMPRDYTVIDPSMTNGATVHIMGDMAVRFVRYRDINEFNSVADRMERQVLYITALLDKLTANGALGMYDVIEPYLGNHVITDMSAEYIDSLSDYNYTNCRVDLVPGEMVMGERYEEYYIDEEALQEYIINNYYILVE